ncbi:MAG: FkbM family methyltransferase, partial [Alphaproteobacteria bacterium]
MTSYVLLEQEDWFEPELAFFRKIARPGLRALDVGANFGVFTLSLARAAGPSGQIFAFEPSARTAGYLRAGIAANAFDNVDLFQLALSNRDGSATLAGTAPELNAIVFPSDDDRRSALDHAATAPAAAGEHVEVTTLDQWAAARDTGPITLVKLDAEGEEVNIVAGGHRFFSERDPLVMLEVKQGQLVDLTSLEALQRLGYSPYRLVPGLGVLAPLDKDRMSGDHQLDPYQLNLFCCKPTRAAS